MNNNEQAIEVASNSEDYQPQPVAIVERRPQELTKPAITPAQAKVEAIANLTMSAYQRAATLELSQEEIEKLAADFPDESIQPGAAGKENLLYIQHAWLRDRLNAVFRPGQWSIVPRNRWAEPFKTQGGKDASRVYVEAMLVIRGCFAGEAIGEMEYFPHNSTQNYGDAVEGAKTAALRRCCKELGVGLQVYKKEWCEGWWQRRKGQAPALKPHAVAKPSPAPQPKPALKPATVETRNWMIDALKDCRALAIEYFEKIGQLLPTEGLEDLPLRFVPITHGQLVSLKSAIASFGNGEQAGAAFPPNPQPQAEEDDVPMDFAPAEPEPLQAEDEAWRSFLIPFGPNKGTPLGELDHKKLWGWWANYKVEAEYNGKPKKPETIAKDQAFRAALDEAGKHYNFAKKEAA